MSDSQGQPGEVPGEPQNGLNPGEQPAPDASVPATSAEAPASGESEPSETTYSKAELEKIVAKERAKAERKAQRDADRRVAEALQSAKPKEEPAPPAPDGRPDATKFASTEDYVEAVSEWKANQIIEKREKARAETDARTQQERQHAEIMQAHTAREDAARDKYADYDDVVFDDTLPISKAMADTFRVSEQGPELAYFLGKNRDEAARIAKLPPILAVKELGKLEARLQTPARKNSSAPDPINPLQPRGGQSFTNLDDPKALKTLGTTGLIQAWEKQAREAAQKGR